MVIEIPMPKDAPKPKKTWAEKMRDPVFAARERERNRKRQSSPEVLEAKRRWYAKEYANNPTFRAKQDAKRMKWLDRKRGTREFRRLSLDTEALQYLDLISALKSAGVPFVERSRGNCVTVSFAKSALRRVNLAARR